MRRRFGVAASPSSKSHAKCSPEPGLGSPRGGGVCGPGKPPQFEITSVDREVALQKFRVALLQLAKPLMSFGQMLRSVALRFCQLSDIVRHQGALGVIVEEPRQWLIRKRIQVAAERLAVSQDAPRFTEKPTIELDTQAPELSTFLGGQRDLEWWSSAVDVTAAAAFGAAVE
jgi:hypothetical protein